MMKSMKLSKKESKDMAEPMATDEQAAYPYGLSLHLDNETMKKLGMKCMPEAGEVMNLTAKVSVTEVSQSERKGGEPMQRMTLQITDMDLACEEKENDVAAKLYGKKEEKAS